MNGVKNYDGDLRMFRETTKEVSIAHLRFLRWLVEQGRMDHPPSGPPSGEYADEPALLAREAA